MFCKLAHLLQTRQVSEGRLLLVLQFLQSSDGRLHCDCRSGIVGPGPTGHCFHAGTTMPDANGSSLHLGLATEGASVLGVLADLNFLHHFLEGGTIAGPVFPNHPDLLGAFSHVTRIEAQTGRGLFSHFKISKKTVMQLRGVCSPRCMSASPKQGSTAAPPSLSSWVL